MSKNSYLLYGGLCTMYQDELLEQQSDGEIGVPIINQKTCKECIHNNTEKCKHPNYNKEYDSCKEIG